MSDRGAPPAPGEPRRPVRVRKPPLSVERILDTAFALVETEGYEALTMRRVAAALGTGPASLYAHVRDKADLDDLLVSALCARVTVPEPDPERWREQVVEICGKLRDQYFRYPGISQAALATAPRGPEALGLVEGLLAIVLAGGVPPRAAAWGIDAALLYVGAYSLEASMRRHADAHTGRRPLDRDEVVARFRALPADRFPHLVAHAPELAAGAGHERFDYALALLLAGLDAGGSGAGHRVDRGPGRAVDGAGTWVGAAGIEPATDGL